MVPYRFKLYDDRNILVAERVGTTFVMPNSVTPVYEGGIETGNRIASRTYFEFAAPFVWERVVGTAEAMVITGKSMTDPGTTPRVTATAENTAVSDVRDMQFVAVVFDPGGNAIGASRTIIPLLRGGERKELVFTWPDPFLSAIGRIDVIPLRMPELVTQQGWSL
jgi:hypothetical protein